ncbi:hypothetical protein ACFO25_06180 [Paenactinomyces guangxiensis]|uniref:Uncharacterized protein n=1 Tax=Paenactinomyces guangxiensis TaxID=1490290 RepID=A0A7W2A8T1_9BACL|nr:hypothetical protein [Paenactinomyces guangxiensis]MBA4494178.1 hypothetical protein [Paenactinomyces guangxiensis]MBH8590674.1 hypothetical protein [Paenactinomyces guangxiensis]
MTKKALIVVVTILVLAYAVIDYMNGHNRDTGVKNLPLATGTIFYE